MSENNINTSYVSLKDINKIYPNGVQAVYNFNITAHSLYIINDNKNNFFKPSVKHCIYQIPQT